MHEDNIMHVAFLIYISFLISFYFVFLNLPL